MPTPSRAEQHSIDEFKARVTAAFKAVHQQGFVTRQAFWCCRSCGASALNGILKARPHIKGAIWYSRQSVDGMADPKEPGVYVCHGGPVNAEGEANLVAGRALVEAARAVGLVAEWDGTEADCVYLRPRNEAERNAEAEQAAEADALVAGFVR